VTTSGTGVPPVILPLRPWYVLGLSFSISLLLSLWFAFLIGRNLGLFFGGLVLAAILAPLLVVAERDLSRRLSIAGGIVAAIAIVWLGSVFNGTIGIGEWFSGTLVLLIFTLAITALAALLERIHIPPAVVVILSLAWLSWPVWLAPSLRGRESSERTVAVLVAANPTFAIQGALSQSFPVPWAQHRIAYRLTNIGDDIPYQMPTSIVRCLIVHGVIAAIAMLGAHWPRRARLAAPPAHPPADQSPIST
jgi:hypothetical protein